MLSRMTLLHNLSSWLFFIGVFTPQIEGSIPIIDINRPNRGATPVGPKTETIGDQVKSRTLILREAETISNFPASSLAFSPRTSEYMSIRFLIFSIVALR